jgi:UDP-4-amino-4,6-dideoxy-N-acetyl-beta-L-altrosamine transaminase
MIPYGRQDVTQEDIDAVLAVLRSDFLTQGPTVPKFERAVATRVGAARAVAMNSATSALHVACMALDLGPGDGLWTVPTTFVASANCARYCGADVDFVDIDPRSWNMSVPALEEKLERAARSGRLPKVLVPVHLCGQPTDQEAIHALSRRYGVRVLEDASHAVGAARHGEPVGSCRWSDVAVFSFHPVKIMTSAEGGMAMTNDPALAERMELLRSHGITRDPSRFVQAPDTGAPAWYYEMLELGFNYRMTDLHAALGCSQLARLDAYLARRNQLAKRYDEALRDLPLALPNVPEGNLSSFHIYPVRVHDSETRRVLFERLRADEIGVNLHYAPVHLQPYYRRLGFVPGMFPEAEANGDTAITLPIYPAMGDEAQERVVDRLRAALS